MTINSWEDLDYHRAGDILIIIHNNCINLFDTSVPYTGNAEESSFLKIKLHRTPGEILLILMLYGFVICLSDEFPKYWVPHNSTKGNE